MAEETEELHLPGARVAELLQTLLDKGADVRFRVTGTSMKPAIRSRDLVTLSALKGLSPRVGEVVAFHQPDSRHLAIHRVIGKKQETFAIKGDNQSRGDAPVPLQDILAVVTGVERAGRALFWPDRFRRRYLSRVYFRAYLIRLQVRRLLKTILNKLQNPGANCKGIFFAK